MENASSKVVFRLTHRENLEPLAQWLFMGTMNPDEIKHELYSTKVMEYREELRTTYTRSSGRSWGKSSGGGMFGGTTTTRSHSGTIRDEEDQDPNLWNESEAASGGTSNTWTDSEIESDTESSTESTILIPGMGKELSNVQFRSLDEQLFRAMAVLFDQQERFSVARVVGMPVPVSLHTPTVQSVPSSQKRIQKYLESRYKKLGFALPGSEAHKQLATRAEQLPTKLSRDAIEEPTTTRRKIA